VDYATSDGTATLADGDYISSSGTLSWPAGDGTDRTFTVDIGDDLIEEGDETIQITLSNPTGGAILGAPAAATLTIQETWTRDPGNPVLGPSAGPAWDDTFVGQPWVLGPPSGFADYRMWYVGGDSSGNLAIGYATSPDGVTWTRHPGNPVLSPGAPTEWDDAGIGGPFVLYDSGAGTFFLYYHGGRSIGLATSPDGITWTKEATNPVLDAGSPTGWDDGNAHFPCVLRNGPTWYMWYTGNDQFGPVQTLRIGRASSPDGVTWTKSAANPVLIPDTSSFETPGVGYARVIDDGWPTLRMLYTGGASLTGVFGEEVGYARSIDGGLSWTKFQDTLGVPVPLIRPAPAIAWDDTLVYLASWETIAPGEVFYEAADSSGLHQIGRATQP
jgi:predicted GH43/DUF377 family glycosyl hydrolase